ncbi:uncharacterized protein PHALS_11049 [Plasmopara halstedii]|uniref:Uncharacterized protein n=1 Tax=Plasmopara halstedii TaxID=4781 RepID=A0A0P1AI67_PLAHL|nr:uncharacterized protein PHALS_11049 [Plasmopara halstedii]CEG40870.1 hypothetical protein PHALS_11049 [Plasmopara halstedii]|eukprot:XP_024577239.1 hypothetical protein PHALS_11049 [Plasmopara halstedii]
MELATIVSSNFRAKSWKSSEVASAATNKNDQMLQSPKLRRIVAAKSSVSRANTCKVLRLCVNNI